MPIANFAGQTLVAFTDIAGFKAMMNDGNRGAAALDTLYQSGFSVISHQQVGPIRVEGIFVSDCGVLFVRGNEEMHIQLFEALLKAVEALNRRCFERAVSLTTAIAWGEFSYHERIEIPGIEKNPVYGNAYVSAFRDHERAPRLYPNECRIVKRNLPGDVLRLCSQTQGAVGGRMRDAQHHFYFEWMRPS
jgi:hypothetical protein